MIFKDLDVLSEKNSATTTFLYLYVGALAIHSERGGKVVESDEKVERLLRLARAGRMSLLKVPKREIFDRSDFPDFYAIKSSWVGDLLVKILTYYFNF
jgi:hypothetical protein